MFRTFFALPRRTPKDIEGELHSLCHADQIERLAMPAALRKDVGLDCGCDRPLPDLGSRFV